MPSDLTVAEARDRLELNVDGADFMGPTDEATEAIDALIAAVKREAEEGIQALRDAIEAYYGIIDVDAPGPLFGTRCSRCGTFHDVVMRTGCPALALVASEAKAVATDRTPGDAGEGIRP